MAKWTIELEPFEIEADSAWDAITQAREDIGSGDHQPGIHNATEIIPPLKEWIIDLCSFMVEAATEDEALERAVQHLSDGGEPRIDQILPA